MAIVRVHLLLCRRFNGEAFQQIRAWRSFLSLQRRWSSVPGDGSLPLLSSSFLSSCSVDGASIFSLRERSKWPINSERRGSGVQPKIVSALPRGLPNAEETALELVFRVPRRIPGTEVSFVAGNTGGRGKGKELFPRLTR